MRISDFFYLAEGKRSIFIGITTTVICPVFIIVPDFPV